MTARPSVLAISLWEPWASLVAIGAKRFETRDWPIPPSARSQPIAIQAAKRVDVDVLFRYEVRAALVKGGVIAPRFSEDWPSGWTEADKRACVAQLPLGKVVAIGETQSCYRVTKDFLDGPYFRREDLPFGNYALDGSRWAWDLGTVVRLRSPIPARGFQKLWRWTPPAALWELEPEAFERSTVRCPGCRRVLGGALVFSPERHPEWGCGCEDDCLCESCIEADRAREAEEDLEAQGDDGLDLDGLGEPWDESVPFGNGGI